MLRLSIYCLYMCICNSACNYCVEIMGFKVLRERVGRKEALNNIHWCIVLYYNMRLFFIKPNQ